jgi:hypothetical protein
LLPKLYYCHGGLVKRIWSEIPSQKNQPKKLSQNGRIQIDLSKMALWSSWTWGQKKPYGGFFLTKIPNKKKP